jgi:hypothetical protein
MNLSAVKENFSLPMKVPGGEVLIFVTTLSTFSHEPQLNSSSV